MMYKIKMYIRRHEKIMILLSRFYNFLGCNRIRGKYGISFSTKGCFMRHTCIRNYGVRNSIEFGKGTRLYNCNIQMFGNDNKIVISSDCECKEMDIWISDGGEVRVGNNTHFTGKIHIACIEGKKVTIGKNCLFSNDIVFRTGDSHIITDMEDNRLNFGADICIGNHTWMGQQVVVLKGAIVGKDSIIGTRSLITGKCFPNNVIIAGSPAKVIRENVQWKAE